MKSSRTTGSQCASSSVTLVSVGVVAGSVLKLIGACKRHRRAPIPRSAARERRVDRHAVPVNEDGQIAVYVDKTPLGHERRRGSPEEIGCERGRKRANRLDNFDELRR